MPEPMHLTAPEIYYSGGVGMLQNMNITSSTTTNVEVWGQWVLEHQLNTSGSVCITNSTAAWTFWNTSYVETEARQAERERQAAEHAARREENRREREAARERALELLGYVLTEEQMTSYQEKGWFEVISNKGRRFRIRDNGVAGNVDLMPEIGEQREATYCAHPPGGLPDPDVHAAQALALATDEESFLQVANCHYRRTA
jgi:hypothetical protein